MISRIKPVALFDLIVFGGTGDLARRKLLPGMYYRERDGQIPDGARIIGVARRKLERQDFVNQTEASVREHVPARDIDETCLSRYLDRIHYQPVDATNPDDFRQLKALVGDGDHSRVFYLATSPEIFGPTCHSLDDAGLVHANTRVVLEKPIGKDLASAQQINDAVGEVLKEDQIYRIDHYLGKETVQNLMALRFANSLFEPLWNAAHIDHVQITVAETLGVGGRAGYYDGSGALRDMVQNHIMQLVCLVAMEPPIFFDGNAVRDEKIKVLKALKPITENEIAQKTVRGQYRSGAVGGEKASGYLEELESGRSITETFCVVKAEIENWRWAGVPFYLRTGKRMPARLAEIVIEFKKIPHSIFERRAGRIFPNRLIVRLQPDEGIQLKMMSKEPGPGGIRLREVPLNLSFAETFEGRSPDAYERLLMDVIRGDPTLFMRRDEVEASWEWNEPILNAWKDSNEAPKPYPAGTWGPSASIALIERDGRTWHEEAA